MRYSHKKFPQIKMKLCPTTNPLIKMINSHENSHRLKTNFDLPWRLPCEVISPTDLWEIPIKPTALGQWLWAKFRVSGNVMPRPDDRHLPGGHQTGTRFYAVLPDQLSSAPVTTRRQTGQSVVKCSERRAVTQCCRFVILKFPCISHFFPQIPWSEKDIPIKIPTNSPIIYYLMILYTRAKLANNAKNWRFSTFKSVTLLKWISVHLNY